MSKQVIYGVPAAFGGRRISFDASKYTLDLERELVMWSSLEQKVDQGFKGRFKTAVDFSGATDSLLEQRMLLSLQDDNNYYPVSIGLNAGGAVGSFAYLSQALLTSFKWSGDAGQMRQFECKVLPQDRAWLGRLLGNSGVGGAITTPGALPGVQLGAIAATVTGVSPVAGQFGLFAVHILDPPGVAGTASPTLQLVLESNPNNTDWTTAVARVTLPLAVTGTPTTGQFKAPGALWIVIDGDVAPVTDTWWRLRASAVGGTAPSFYLLAAGAVGSKLNV